MRWRLVAQGLNNTPSSDADEMRLWYQRKGALSMVNSLLSGGILDNTAVDLLGGKDLQELFQSPLEDYMPLTKWEDPDNG